MLNLAPETIALIKGLRKDITTSGISSGTGLDFYYLEPQAKNIYPVFYPILASTPRVNPMFNGMKVGGQAVNWKAVVGIDANGYPGLSEGNRNAFMNITTRNYSSNFKMLGKDIQTSFFAQQTGLGFDDMVGLAQFSMMNALLNDEERMMLFGNDGPSTVGGNGYALGTTNTPVLTQSNVAGSSVAASAQNYVFAVALTPWGVSMSGATGIVAPYLRTNADGSQDTINGGTGIISLVSNSVVTDASHLSITVTIPYSVGAAGYAIFLNQLANTTSGAYFCGVSSTPVFTITTTPASTNQQANYTNPTTSKGFTADYSWNLLDFPGILTYHFGTFGASQPAYLKDLGGSGFTSNGDGTIAEFEACADYLWLNYKVSIDAIRCGGALIHAISRAALTSNAGNTGNQRLIIERTSDGQVTGGQLLTQYNWKYSNNGLPKQVPVTTHPWLPNGVVLFDIFTNPYPAAGDTIPAVRRIVSLEDHFGLKWPYRKLQHELGVYCFETQEHYLPFAGGVLTGCNNSVN